MTNENSSEGRERLANQSRIYKWTLIDGYYYDGSHINIQPLGGFSISIIDPGTGELLDEQRAPEVVKRNKAVYVYDSLPEEGHQVILTAHEQLPGGGIRDSLHFIRYTNNRWEPVPMAPTTTINLIPKSLPAMTGYAKLPSGS